MTEITSTLIDLALAEDLGQGDVTSCYFVDTDRVSRALILAKNPGVIAGVNVAIEVFKRVDPEIRVNTLVRDGSRVASRAGIVELSGKARSLLTAERTALNFLQRLSGVATKTSQFVDLVKSTSTKILDTRKTTPGWRELEKAAVVAGGGYNHRMGLYDRAMVKDNHLMVSDLDELQNAIDRLRREKPDVQVELEADRLDQVEAFLGLTGVDYLLLDNMSCEEMRQAVRLRGHDGPLLEASGGVDLTTVAEIAATGVDFISVGALTHSAVALDLSLEFLGNEDRG